MKYVTHLCTSLVLTRSCVTKHPFWPWDANVGGGSGPRMHCHCCATCGSVLFWVIVLWRDLSAFVPCAHTVASHRCEEWIIHIPMWEMRIKSGRHQAIIWTNANILSIRPRGTCFNEILLEIQIYSFKEMRFNMSSAKWRPFCPEGDEIRHRGWLTHICISKLDHRWSR